MKNDSVVRFAFAEYVSPLTEALDEIAEETGMFKMVLGCSNCTELIAGLSKMESLPDICIIGIRDGENLFEVLYHIEFIKIKWPAIGILVFTGLLHSYFMNQFIALGVNGILNRRNDKFDNFFKAMKNVQAYGFHYGSLASEDQFEAVRQKTIDVSPLTEREIGLIRYRCEGNTYMEIAIALKEEYMTVYRACKKLSNRLSLKKRFGLIEFGHYSGIDYQFPLKREVFHQTKILSNEL